MSPIRFGAQIRFNTQENKLLYRQNEALKMAFDDKVIGKRVTGKDQTLRIWMEDNLHDGLTISYQRETLTKNGPTHNTTRIKVNGQNILTATGGLPGLPKQGLPTRRAMLSFAQNALRKMLLWNQAVVDKLGWDYDESVRHQEGLEIYDQFRALEKKLKGQSIPFPQKPVDPNAVDIDTLFEEAEAHAENVLKKQ